MIKFDRVLEITQYLQLSKIDGYHIESRCPFCGDSRTKKSVRRFYIDPYKDTFIYKCFRCGETGNVIQLYSHFFDCSYDDAKKYLENKKYDPEKLKKQLKNRKQYINKDVIVDGDLDLDIDRECLTINSVPKDRIEKNAIEKLKKFKESRKIPDSLPLYIAHSGRYKSRIIVPVYINNKLVYFQGRTVYDEITPKYLNPSVEKNKAILNIDHFEKEKYIVICEGIIDAHMVGNQGTCVIGGYIDLEFLSRISPYTDKGTIICLDNPKTDNNSYNVLKKLIFKKINRYKEDIRFFFMPDEYKAKDLNDLVRDYDIKNVYDFVIENSVSIIKAKMMLVNMKNSGG